MEIVHFVVFEKMKMQVARWPTRSTFRGRKKMTMPYHVDLNQSLWKTAKYS